MPKCLRFLFNHWPGCYCQACGQCAYRASYRFPARFYNSCEACLTCPGSRLLWTDERYELSPNPAPSMVYFRMSRWYRFRYWLGCVVTYIGGVWIHPKDEAYAKKAKEPVGV
jgi:hypothetical protein